MVFRFLRRLWIALVVLAVAGVGGFTVSRIHGVFGAAQPAPYADTATGLAAPSNPKRVTYEVFGAPGTVADINYIDGSAGQHRVDGVRLPWSVQLTAASQDVMGDIVAQGNSSRIGCRITVDGEVKAERISTEVSAYTFCLLKPA